MKIVIIGNGVAGISAAEAIRNKSKDIEIVMYSDEKFYHYSRPRVIEYLSGKISSERLIIKNKEFYEQNNIKINLNTKIKKIDVNLKKVICDSGDESFDRLIIAAGAKSFLPPVKGSDLSGVFTLRTIEDAEKIIEFARGKKSAVVIGGGLLGIEAAMSIFNLGLSVTVVEVFERLLPRQLDKDGAVILQKMIEAKGLKFLLSKQTEKIESKDEKLEVIFKDGEKIITDLILFSAGIRSNLEIVKETGIEIDKGIKINENMQTSVKDIYAAGDIAKFNGVVYGIWSAAKEQGWAAGLNASGEDIKYKGSILSTKLKITGIELASIGDIEKKEKTEIFTKAGEGIYKRLFIENKIITGAILLGDTKEYQKIQEIIKNKMPVNNPSELI